MHLDEAQGQLLKHWIIKKLEETPDTDADAEVLADYVLELVRGENDLAAVRETCVANLGDFLQSSTDKFVNDFVKAIETKSYDPSHVAKITNSQPPSGPRKRTFDDRGDDSAPNGRYPTQGDRPVKQPRRGGRGGFDNNGGRSGQQPWQAPAFQPGAMPPMNPQEAFGALLAMQQALGFPTLPGMPQAGAFGERKSRGRCRDYDNKGFCARGASCKFQHGADAVVVDGEGYDPAQAMMQPLSDHYDATSGRGQQRGRGGRGRGGQTRGNGRRAEFSLAGPSQDKTLTALVVEQIPEDKFDEQVVRDFFNQYGTIQKVEMQPYKRLAIVTFDSWDEANAAYTSPKVIFDNRFVKVFWYKPGATTSNGLYVTSGSTDQQDTEMKTDEPEIDHEEIARRQEEAQRKHEEAQKKRDEAQKQKSDIDAKLKAMDEERKKFAELLAKKSRTSTTSTDAAVVESEQTKGLKAQLAKLEAEAKSLGIDPDTSTDWQNGQAWRGRGGYRGRGRFPTRAAFRGGWAGAAARGGAVKRLDNRPKTLSVAFPQGTFDQYDEAMRQYLLFSDNLEHATLSRHPTRADAAMIAFEERYRAENFMTATKGPSGIPNIGAVEVSWMSNPVKPVNGTSNMSDMMVDDSTAMSSDVTQHIEGEADYDIAEDDRWV